MMNKNMGYKILTVVLMIGFILLPMHTSASETDTSDACDHKYEYKELVYPTDTEEAARLYECVKCGATNKEIIYHDDSCHFTDSITTEKNSSGGCAELFCRFCGFHYYENFLSGWNHDFERIVKTKPTVFRTGEIVYVCKECGTVLKRHISRLESKCTLSAKSKTLRKYQTYKLKVSKLSKGDKVAKFSSSNNGVATVTKTGLIKARKKGKATITVLLKSGKRAKCQVTVR